MIKVLPESLALDAERVMRFTREAKTLASLNHPNIAQIYGLDEGRAESTCDDIVISFVGLRARWRSSS